MRLGRVAPTIHDVARAAGVSINTCSKALNNKGKLKIETRERVRNAAAQLGFRPNELAQSLLRGRSFTVGLLISDIYPRVMPLLAGIEDTWAAAQISVFLCNAHDDRAREQQHLNALLAKQVDGIIVAGRRVDLRASVDLDHSHTPLVYVYSPIDDPDALCLIPNESQGARLAIEHLCALGCRGFAHISGPRDRAAIQIRAATMRQVLDEHGYDLPARRVLHGSLDEPFGYAAANSLLDRDPNIDAIFCGSDVLARGVLDALRERGVRVPDDVAVVGYHNMEPIATAARPPLTSIDANLYELGHRAAHDLIAMINGQPRSGVHLLPFRLVVRQSCGAR